MNYLDIAKRLNDNQTMPKRGVFKKEQLENDEDSELNKRISGSQSSSADSSHEEKSADNWVEFIRKHNELYERGCDVKGVENAIRVEQGEFSVLKKTNNSPCIGTHHVTPCVVICVIGNLFFGMAHFDSYRTTGSLEEFFKPFKNDGTLQIKLFGGKLGSDPLRSGDENKTTILNYIQQHLSAFSLLEITPEMTPIDLILMQNGDVEQRKFAVGINVHEQTGALMRLQHSIHAIIIAQQSRSGDYIPVNLIKAFEGDKQTIFVDRLALKALKEFDTTPIEGEEQGWTVDPGGYTLSQEINYAHSIISSKVHNAKTFIESGLYQQQVDISLQQKLIDISPVYIGLNAEDENLNIVNTLIDLCSNNKDEQTIVNEALLFFNQVSSYPLMKNLVSTIETAYAMEQNSLMRELTKKFGNIEPLAYGVDIVTPNIVEIINQLRQTKNHGLVLTQQLKTHCENTQMLISSLSTFYSLEEQPLLLDITAAFNQQIATDETTDQIIAALDEKNSISKNNILQAIEICYSGTKKKLLNRKLNEIWETAISPKNALQSLTHLFPEQSFDLMNNEYNALAKTVHKAHLQERESTEIINISFHDRQTGIQKVMGTTLKNVIVHVMSKNTLFCNDYAQEEVTEATFIRTIRHDIPYKKDTTHEVLSNADKKVCYNNSI